MTATFILQRHEDPSGISGTGEVAWGAEFPDGAVAVRWPGIHPSTATWGDIRDVEAIHGHGGKTTVSYESSGRLLAAYQLVMRYALMSKQEWQPLQAAPHPDHPDRLRLVFKDERTWRWWIALLDGSTDAASHEEVAGEMRHTWVTPDGNVWLIWHSPLLPRVITSEAFVVPMDDDETPLQNFEREDR